MQKKDYSNVKSGPKKSPIVEYMEKKITVRMLEAHFNALPELLRYVIAKADTDINARLALNNFTVAARKERQTLDPCEAVFGFTANLIRNNESDDEDSLKEKSELADFVARFCEANGLGMPEGDWTKRLKFIKP